MKYILLIIIFTLAFSVSAEWVDFGIDGSAAHLTLLESSATGMILELEIPGVELISETVNGVEYTHFNIPACTPTSEGEGCPTLPKVSFMAAIPENANINIIMEAGEVISLGEHTPYPMQPFLLENSNVAEFTVSPEFYTGVVFPEEHVLVDITGILRGINTGRFSIIPFIYNGETGEVTVTPRMRIEIDFGGAVSVDRRLYSRFWRNTFRQNLINWEILGEPEMSVTSDLSRPAIARTREQAKYIDEADLLIMAGDDFFDTMIDDFITAKHNQGFITAAVAAGSWTSTEIKDYIQNAYDTWPIPPSFILFVGDDADITPYTSSPTGIDTDNRYCCVDGSDWIADIFHGRFVTPTDFYEIVEDKILKWEFDPLMDEDFWNNALCAGMLETGGGTVSTRWFCFTLESVRDTYLNIGKTVEREYVKDTSAPPPYYYRDYLPSAGQMVPADIVWDGSTSGIINSINSGVFLAQHRDHGSQSGWSHPSFTISDLSSLTNGEKTPMVFSFNCSTGLFVGGTCFAEVMFRMDGGAVMVVAANGGSFSYFNDYMVYGMYYAFNDEFTSPPAPYTFPQGNYLAGQSMMCGKLEMQEAAPYNPYSYDLSEETWDLFHIFGDPTMDMRTEVPVPLIVAAPAELPVGTTEATFTVSIADGPVDGAMVCLRKEDEDLYASGLTDATGTVVLTFDPITIASNAPWMSTAHNTLPEEGIILGPGGVGEESGTAITAFGLPYPNPCSGRMSFPVSLASSGNVDIDIFDITGRLVHTISSGTLESGEHSLIWNGRIEDRTAPAGIYMVRLKGDNLTETYRVVLTR